MKNLARPQQNATIPTDPLVTAAEPQRRNALTRGTREGTTIPPHAP